MTDNNDHTRTPNLVLSVLGAAIVLTIFVPATLYCTPLGRSWRMGMGMGIRVKARVKIKAVVLVLVLVRSEEDD
ncbi:hypothetical protein M432DRAFT_642367 [Thermoascus aurantiacus ATCC 26904]